MIAEFYGWLSTCGLIFKDKASKKEALGEQEYADYMKKTEALVLRIVTPSVLTRTK